MRPWNSIRRALPTSGLIIFLASSVFAQGTLTIHHLDVGTGDATLLIMPNGRTLLVDAGLDGAASRVIGPFLRSISVTNLDAFVLTHYDSDHLGGVDKLTLPQHEGIAVSTWHDRGEWNHLPPRNW